MKLGRNPNSLEFWAQDQFFKNNDGSISMNALHLIWPAKSKTMFQEQVQEAGYSSWPQPSLTEEAEALTKEEFLEMYEFGTPVRSYILTAAAMGKRLSRATLFDWVSKMRPDKVEYGRNYFQVDS